MTEKFEELNLPNAVITRIIKEAIPPGSIVSKECILLIKSSSKIAQPVLLVRWQKQLG